MLTTSQMPLFLIVPEAETRQELESASACLENAVDENSM